MSSTSSRESSTMSTCSGAMAFRVPNSSSVFDFMGNPPGLFIFLWPRWPSYAVLSLRQVELAETATPPRHYPGIQRMKSPPWRTRNGHSSEVREDPWDQHRDSAWRFSFLNAGEAQQRWAPLRPRRAPRIAIRQDGP